MEKTLAKDIGRLSRSADTRMTIGTNIILFVHPIKMTRYKKIAYSKLVATIRLLKSEVNRVRVTIGNYRPDHV